MAKLYDKVADAYFIVATFLLLLIAVLLLLGSVWEMAIALMDGHLLGLLEAVGLIVIGFAIVETSRFIAEEEILREKELRSAVESRRSLTKFVTIIVIAASLEALVMTFETSRTDVTRSIYPAALFGIVMLSLVSLGLFQWLSSRIAQAPETSKGDDMDHHETTKAES